MGEALITRRGGGGGYKSVTMLGNHFDSYTTSYPKYNYWNGEQLDFEKNDYIVHMVNWISNYMYEKVIFIKDGNIETVFQVHNSYDTTDYETYWMWDATIEPCEKYDNKTTIVIRPQYSDSLIHAEWSYLIQLEK